MTWMIGVGAMKQKGLWKKMPLIPLWDAFAFFIWLNQLWTQDDSWRGIDYFLREGRLVAVDQNPAQSAAR
jgi:hypothetical protein